MEGKSKRRELRRMLRRAWWAASVLSSGGGMVEPPPGISLERWEELVSNEAERRRSGTEEPLRKKVGNGRKPLEQLLVEQAVKRKATKKRGRGGKKKSGEKKREEGKAAAAEDPGARKTVSGVSGLVSTKREEKGGSEKVLQWCGMALECL